ncbi:MAG TPA: chloride channel protein [Bryobacteraceae bacterium]|nr:chloride channel protein [Bryobacteraceae bacterium]
MKRFRSNTLLILDTALTGLLAGLGAVGFHYLSDTLGEHLFTWGESHRAVTRLPFVLAIPTLGLALVGALLQIMPESRLGGVTEVLNALEIAKGMIPFRRILNVILSGLVLAFGGSVGPEGPMVQLGALFGSLVGRHSGIGPSQLQTIVKAGAASGIAAAFRSPAGGVLLSIELFGVGFSQDLTAVGLAAAIGYLTRTALLGDAYPFRPPGTMESLPLVTLLVIVPLMGLLAAPTGHLFIWMFNRFQTVFPKRWPLTVRVAAGGFLVGTIAIWYPQVLSAGYPVIERGLRGGIGFELFVVLLLLKMLATSITFGSGAVGGLFAPTLVIGAMYGGAVGYGLAHVVPWAAPQPELFVLLGMVVMFGSIVKGYWSGLLMVADMSGCYHQLLLPGAIAGGISFFMSWELHDRSIFGLTIDRAGRSEVV